MAWGINVPTLIRILLLLVAFGLAIVGCASPTSTPHQFDGDHDAGDESISTSFAAALEPGGGMHLPLFVTRDWLSGGLFDLPDLTTVPRGNSLWTPSAADTDSAYWIVSTHHMSLRGQLQRELDGSWSDGARRSWRAERLSTAAATRVVVNFWFERKETT